MVGTAEDASPLPKIRRLEATEGTNGTKSRSLPAFNGEQSPYARPLRGQPRRVRRHCLAGRPCDRHHRQVRNRPPRQERHRCPARRPRPHHWSSRKWRCHDDRRDGTAITPATRESARDGDRTQTIRYLTSEAGAVDRPPGVVVAVSLAIHRSAVLCFVCQFSLALYLCVLLCRLKTLVSRWATGGSGHDAMAWPQTVKLELEQCTCIESNYGLSTSDCDWNSRHVRAIPWPSGRWRARRRIDNGHAGRLHGREHVRRRVQPRCGGGGGVGRGNGCRRRHRSGGGPPACRNAHGRGRQPAAQRTYARRVGRPARRTSGRMRSTAAQRGASNRTGRWRQQPPTRRRNRSRRAGTITRWSSWAFRIPEDAARGRRAQLGVVGEGRGTGAVRAL